MTQAFGLGRVMTPPWVITAAANTWTASQRFNDNVLLTLGTTDGTDADIFYDGSNLTIDVNSGELILGSTTGVAQMQTNGLTIGLGASAPDPDNNFVHIWHSTAGSVTADAKARLVLEAGDDNYLNYLGLTNSIQGILFGDADDNDIGSVLYYHSGDTLRFTVAATEQAQWSDGALAFQKATTISTTTDNLTLYAAAGADVIIGDGVRIIAVDGGTNTVGISKNASAAVGLDLGQDATFPGSGASQWGIRSGYNFASDATTAGYAGYFALRTQAASFTMTDGYGVYVPNAVAGAGSTITTTYGIYVEAQTTGGTSNYGIYIAGADTLALWVDSGVSRFDGDIGQTGARVPMIYTTSQTTTNAETVDSSETVKRDIAPYGGDALDIVGKMRVVEFSHDLWLDPSGERKMGIIAESVDEPLAVRRIERGDESYPGLNMYGLSTLLVRALQQLTSKYEKLERMVANGS